MKIEIRRANKQTIQAFARQHDLTMVVEEREAWNGNSDTGRATRLKRYSAQFEALDLASGDNLDSCFGNGDTIDEAIADYALKISGQEMVADALLHSTMRQICVPKLAPYEPELTEDRGAA